MALLRLRSRVRHAVTAAGRAPTNWVLVSLSGVLLLLVLRMGLAPRQSWSSPSNRLGWVGLVLGALIGAGVYTVTHLSDAA